MTAEAIVIDIETGDAPAEALDPATLAAIVRQGIEDNMDLDLYRQVVEKERGERESLLTRLEALKGGR